MLPVSCFWFCPFCDRPAPFCPRRHTLLRIAVRAYDVSAEKNEGWRLGKPTLFERGCDRPIFPHNWEV